MKKPKKAWAPVPVAVQVARHKKAIAAAKKKAAKPVSAKRSAAAKKAAATRAKHRKWSPDEDVALCSARAVAQSLELALGVPVSHDDVLALYWLVADDADAGASILATLEATPAALSSVPAVLKYREFSACPRAEGPSDRRFYDAVKASQQPLILGLDLPLGDSHAVVEHDGRWWSWGEPHDPADFPGAVIDEAWQVTWQ